jgi:selenocysteine lyase/cysteine desulfurase
MKCQKELFSLEQNIHYLNCAYKGPLLKSSEEACITSLIRDRNPINITTDDFFSDAEEVRVYFGKIINANPNNIAIIPSTSYGFSSVLNNIEGKKSGHAITIQDEFPSGYFSLKSWCKTNNNDFIVIGPDENTDATCQSWNNNILSQINEHTSVVLISSIHWMNGLRFDLKEIGQKCKNVGAKLIVDGTQSVGVLQMDIAKYNISALVCATYKWLLGPYSVALAYISDDFEHGKPLEESWINRTNSKDFSKLTNYDESYMPAAGRYNVGELSNFTLMPILRESLKQIIEWGPNAIEAYCKTLIRPLIDYLQSEGVLFEDEKYFSSHLFALQLPSDINLELLKENLIKNKVYTSVRGSFLRVSVNVFNDEKDIQKLIKVIKQTKT